MGLGCAALTGNPRFPTYPNPLSTAQNNAGLSSPATAITLLGQGGAVLMLVLLFMAVTSSTSAELIAVSSLLTFDVYKTYIRPDAPSSKLVQISHYGIILYALVLAVFCCILNAVGLNLTWLLTVLAIIVGGGAVPVGLVLLWKRTSTVAAIAAPWVGLGCGLIAWFVTAWKRSGEISILSTGDTTNAVAGNITSFGVGWVTCVVLTFVFPGRYMSEDVRHVERSNKIQGISTPRAREVSSKSPTNEVDVGAMDEEKNLESEEKKAASTSSRPDVAPTGNEAIDFLTTTANMEPMDPDQVRKGERLATGANLIFFFVAIILVPFTLFGTAYVYSRAFFEGWVVVSFIWVWCSMIICVIYPVVESTGSLAMILKGLGRDVMAVFGGKGKVGDAVT